VIKVFHTEEGYSDKWNFVDDENHMVGYDIADDCCSHGGFFISETIEDSPYDDRPKTDNSCDLSTYKFDTSFFKSIDPGDDPYSQGKTVVFKMISESKPTLYLHLFNVHNGYYSKGFEASFGEIREGHV